MDISPGFVIEDDDLELLGRFTVWMEKAVYHSAVDYNRRQKHKLYEIMKDLTPEAESGYEIPLMDSSEEFDFEEARLSKAFSGLNLLRQRILTLIFCEGLTAQETADRLNCSVDYVYLQKHRALKMLRDKLMRGDG